MIGIKSISYEKILGIPTFKFTAPALSSGKLLRIFIACEKIHHVNNPVRTIQFDPNNFVNIQIQLEHSLEDLLDTIGKFIDDNCLALIE